MFSSIEDALIDYAKGKIIIVVDDENRENEGDMICNAKFATPENIAGLAAEVSAGLCERDFSEGKQSAAGSP